jgi:ubiquinone/menaquinone biosynthesis C-methylase UbiE
LHGAVPPAHAVFIGNGDFEAVGKMLLGHFVGEGGLKPSDKVLDVGCGMGRAALPMVDFLDARTGGSYDGFDIVWKGIEWCQKKYRQYSHFKFVHADVYNLHYNPGGRNKSNEYQFPYPDNTFDFVLLTSVFTHMLPADVENYLSEIARVMKPGATCFITYFVINDESRKLIEQGKMQQNFDFKYNYGNYSLVYDNDPEHAIGFKLDYLQKIYTASGLTIKEPILYGEWSGRKPHYSFQDVIIAHKK